MLDVLVSGVGNTLIPYLDGIKLQEQIHRGVVAGTTSPTVILLEHPSVYTAGKRTLPEELPTDGSEVINVTRGGKITWHGPGQLVGYPILKLPEPIDVVSYVRDLESILIEVLEDFGITGCRVEGRSGVWVGEPGRERKIAAIGIRVEAGVTMHGFALNCNNSLDAYTSIIACGIRDAGVTTMTLTSGFEVSPVDVIESVSKHLRARIMVAA